MQRLSIGETALTSLDATFTEIDFATHEDAARLTNGSTALIIPNDINLDDIKDVIAKAGAIIVQFPKFGDGRAYSQARLLRDRYDYKGPIIARGDVLADQILFMRRCGIDVAEIAANDISAFNHALTEFDQFYQSSSDNVKPVWAIRSA